MRGCLQTPIDWAAKWRFLRFLCSRISKYAARRFSKTPLFVSLTRLCKQPLRQVLIASSDPDAIRILWDFFVEKLSSRRSAILFARLKKCAQSRADNHGGTEREIPCQLFSPQHITDARAPYDLGVMKLRHIG